MKYYCILFGILFQISVFGQCLDYNFIVKKLFDQKFQQNPSSLSVLRAWENSWSNCQFKQDSLYGMLLLRICALETNNKTALEFANKSLEVLKKNDTKISSVPIAYRRIGLCYFDLKDYEKAKEAFELAIKLSNKKLQSEEIIKCYRNLSSIFLNEGDYQVSLKNVEKGFSYVSNSTNSELIFQLYIEKGNVFRRLKDYEKALESSKLALDFAKKTNNQENIARCYELNGRIYSDLKNTELSINNYEKALLFLGKSNPSLQTTILINIGFLYLDKLKKYDLAQKYFEEAYGLSNTPSQKMLILDNLGYTHSQKKEYKIATPIYQRAFKEIYKNFKEYSNENPSKELLKNSSNKTNILTLLKDKADTWLAYFKFEKKNSCLQEALKTYQTADIMIDIMRQEHTGTQSKYFWRNKTRSIYESAIETCFLLKDYQKAFYFFEKSRAVMLNDKINELGAKQTLSEEDQQQERKYIKEISELNANIEKEQNQKKKSDLTTQLYTLQEQQDRFIKSLETKNPAYYQIKYDTTTFQLKDIQNYLKKNHINSLVEYFMGDSATYAIVITPTNVSLKKLSFKPESIQQFLEFCSKNIATKTELSTFLGYSSSLYQSLIEPLNLPQGRIIISQDGAFIPFEAISKSANSPQYLLHDYAISYTYSAQFLMKNQEKFGFLPNKNFLGAAPINFSSKLNTLQGSEQSLKNIEKNYTFGNLLTNQAASRNAFLNEAGNYKIVQLYTHAFADSNDTEPKIYFADSALKVSDLNLTDRFKTNLLILSACKTGVGKVAKGEGVLSLARGFSMAGIRSTITSLWSVEDKDTYTLTELFHHYLNEGLPKDEALQQAKIEFIKQTENQNPYSWAGFILIGDSSKISNSDWIIWALGSALVILLALIFAKKLSSKK